MFSDLCVIDTNEDNEFIKLNNPKAPLFKGFMLAIGLMDPAGEGAAGQHCVLLGGIQADDRFLILDEHSGDITSIIDATISFKDRFYATRVWADTIDIDLMRSLWEADGLTVYKSLGQDPAGQELWLHKTDFWPHFRSRDNIAVIGNVPASVKVSPSVGLNRLVALISSGGLLVHPRCVSVQWCLDQPKPADVKDHPIFKALTYLAWARERQIVENDLTERELPLIAYKNFTKKGSYYAHENKRRR